MTDQIPADKVREIIDEWERIKERADWEDMDNLVQAVRALVPTPKRPTLADMTTEERRDCQWMQADVDEEITAGTREEWVGQYLDRDGKWATICTYPTREEVARHLDYLCWDAYTHTRIIRRYVTTEEEA